MILTQLPDLPPRPETPRNAAFRRMFYSRWGKENWIVCGHAQNARYFEYRQTCSIKAAFKGSSTITSTAAASPSPTRLT